MLRAALLLLVLASTSIPAAVDATELVPLGCILSAECWREANGSRVESLAIPGDTIDRPADLDTDVSPETTATMDALGPKGDQDVAVRQARVFADAVAEIDPFGPELDRLRFEEMKETPGVIGEWPEEFGQRYDNYMKMQRTLDCSADVSTLLAIGDRWDDVAHLGIGDGSDRRKIAIATYRLYLDDCFDRLATKPAYLDRLVLLGKVFGADRFLPFCAGFLMDANVVVTARHCAVDPEASSLFVKDYGKEEREEQIRIRKPVPGTRAMLVTDPTVLYRLDLASEEPSNYNPNVPERDTIAFKLRGFEDPVTRYPLISRPEQWMNLELIGVHDTLIDLSSVDDWSDLSILVDTSELCTAFYVSPPCLFHSCQSRGGLSGTPIFAKTPEGFAFVGVHTGALGVDRAACDFKRKYSFPNYGLDLSEILLQEGTP